MKVRTSELSGVQLDWAVAQIEGYAEGPSGSFWITEDDCVDFKPSSNWAQGGPIIEREGITVRRYTDALWDASIGSLDYIADGPTPLIAAMRCYVASKLGEEVGVPEITEEV